MYDKRQRQANNGISKLKRWGGKRKDISESRAFKIAITAISFILLAILSGIVGNGGYALLISTWNSTIGPLSAQMLQSVLANVWIWLEKSKNSAKFYIGDDERRQSERGMVGHAH